MSFGPRSLDGARRLAWLAVCLIACARAPEPEICPRVEPGELVIAEVRGSGDDIGQFIEIYNAAGRTVDLQGVWIRQLALDGEEQAFLIREPLELGPGGYATVGPGLDELPAWIDYGVGWDISGGDVEDDRLPDELIKYVAGVFELEACGELIDEVGYLSGALPKSGTLACGSATAPPSAGQNDDAAGGCWCIDAAPSDPPLPDLALGSPGRANRCP